MLPRISKAHFQIMGTQVFLVSKGGKWDTVNYITTKLLPEVFSKW